MTFTTGTVVHRVIMPAISGVFAAFVTVLGISYVIAGDASSGDWVIVVFAGSIVTLVCLGSLVVLNLGRRKRDGRGDVEGDDESSVGEASSGQ